MIKLLFHNKIITCSFTGTKERNAYLETGFVIIEPLTISSDDSKIVYKAKKWNGTTTEQIFFIFSLSLACIDFV